MESTETRSTAETYRQPYRPEIAKDGESVSHGPVNSYDDFIWALARKFTASPEEAQAAVNEMHVDIGKCAEGGIPATSNEARLVAGIAWRRLLKFLQ